MSWMGRGSISALALIFVALGLPARAALFTFDGSAVPTPYDASWGYLAQPGGDVWFHAVRFADTSWSSDGQAITLATAHQRGIWIGAFHSSAPSPLRVDWAFSPNSTGNSVAVRAKLSPGATDWSMYMGDNARGASFLFHHDRVIYAYDGGQQTLFLDATQYHWYAFRVQGTQVDYAIDGKVVYSGPAYASGSRSLLVGDGSGSTISGTGSMTIDAFVVDTSGLAVPEPGAAAILAAAGLVALRRRRGEQS